MAKSKSHRAALQRTDRFGRNEMAAVLCHLEGISRAQAERIIDYVYQQINLALLSGKLVDMPSLGRLSPYYVDSRVGRHPRTHEAMDVPSTVRVKFTLAAGTKRLLNDPDNVQGFRNRIASIEALPLLPEETIEQDLELDEETLKQKEEE